MFKWLTNQFQNITQSKTNSNIVESKDKKDKLNLLWSYCEWLQEKHVFII